MFINVFLTYSGKAKNCKDVKDSDPSSVSGIYWIEVDGEKLKVRCEMNSTSGGWTVSLFSCKYLITSIEQILLETYILYVYA